MTETEVRITMSFFIPGNISKHHVKEWVQFYTGEGSIISASNPLKDTDFNQLSEMEEFICHVNTQ